MKKSIRRIENSTILCICFLLNMTVKGQDTNQILDIPELLFNSTIHLDAIKDSVVNYKKTKSHKLSTGFFLSIFLGRDTVSVIVANKHSIENRNSGILKFNSSLFQRPNYGDILTITIPNFENLWITHPTEDLAILPITPIVSRIALVTGKRPFTPQFSESDILSVDKEKELSALEEVIMIGYPKGFSDTANNLPILRKGVTASPIYINYNNKRLFLLDIPIYPGSSGSPIVVYNTNYTSKQGTMIVGGRFHLVGIAMESQNYDARGTTISQDPKNLMPTSTSLPFEIAIIIKANVILDFKTILNDVFSDKRYWKLYEKSLTSSIIE